MSPILKQRLVGFILLIALAIVFWPIIFVQPDSDSPLALAPVPERPVVDTSIIEPPAAPKSSLREQYQAPRVDPAKQAYADEATRLKGDAEQTIAQGSSQLPQAASIDPPTTRKSAPVSAAIDGDGFARSWVLQVAAVETQSRANALVQQLQAKGYDAFARSLKRGDRALWRVQIGPKLERDKLNKIKPIVDKAFGVNATILRYEQ